MRSVRVIVVLALAFLGWAGAQPAGANGTAAAVRDAGGGRTATAVPGSRCFPSPDNGDPILRTFEITPRAVDARTTAQTVTFTATAEDTGGPGAATGVTGGWVFIGLSDDPVAWNMSAKLRPDGSGGLVGQLRILPQLQTTTRFVSVSVDDAAGNTTLYSTADLEATGLPATFTTTTTENVTRPRVRTLHFSAATIDTRRHSRYLTVQVHASAPSGVTRMRAWLWGSSIRSTIAHRFRLVSGTATDGTWQDRIRVPRWQGNSVAKIALEVYDEIGNISMYDPRKLATIGQPGRVRIISATEPAAPVIRIRSVSPSTVDLRAASASEYRRVTVVARVTDHGSGVRVMQLQFSGPSIDGASNDFDWVRFVRVSGTTRDGLWRAVVKLPACGTTAGAWHATVFAWDAASGNYATSRQAVAVANADILRPRAALTNNDVPVRTSGPVAVSFSEEVAGVGGSNVVVHVGDDRRGKAGDDPAEAPGTWACRNAAAAPVDCLTGPVRTAAFTPAAPMLPGANYSATFAPEHVLGVTDLTGNPFGPADSVSFHTG